MHHVVLIWSHAGHTYGIGFHNTRGIHRTLLLDEELARHIRLVGASASKGSNLPVRASSRQGTPAARRPPDRPCRLWTLGASYSGSRGPRERTHATSTQGHPTDLSGHASRWRGDGGFQGEAVCELLARLRRRQGERAVCDGLEQRERQSAKSLASTPSLPQRMPQSIPGKLEALEPVTLTHG
jgi:hypothetical protein